MLALIVHTLLAFGLGASSAPTVKRDTTSNAVTALSTTQINSFIPYCWFAAAAYCPQPSQASWSCKSCQADPVKDLIVYNSGGDGGVVQFWYVGWWPSGQSVVVAHQGTELNDTNAVMTDLNFIPLPLNTTLFPGAPMDALVHLGFKTAHARTADVILSTVKKVIAERGAKNVISVGHSLGGALALLEGLSLRLNLPSSINVVTRTFGQPRVGNANFANFTDSQLTDLARVTIKRDLVPTLPPLALLFSHTNGEVHLDAQNVYESCPGHDNPSVNCSTGQVSAQGVFLTDHLGPYPGGVMMGTDSTGSLC